MTGIRWKNQAINDVVKISRGIAREIGVQAADNTIDMMAAKVEKLEIFPTRVERGASEARRK